MTDFKNRIKEIQEKVKNYGIVINRVPSFTRQSFVKLADEEFSGDYGMLLKTLLDNYLEYKYFKVLFFDNIDMKLDKIIKNTQPITIDVDENSKETIKLLNGRELNRIKKEVK